MQPLCLRFSATNVLEGCHSLLTAVGVGVFNRADAALQETASSLRHRGKRFKEGLGDGQNQSDFRYCGKAVRIIDGVICSTYGTDGYGAAVYIFAEQRESRNHSDVRRENEYASKGMPVCK